MVRRSTHSGTIRGTARGMAAQQTHSGYTDDKIPEVYQEMHAEAEMRALPSQGSDRPIKRRRVGKRSGVMPVGAVPDNQRSHDVDATVERHDAETSTGQLQTAYDSTASEDSEMEWEEVDLQQAPSETLQATASTKHDDGPLQITLGPQIAQKKRLIGRRRPITALEKRIRLDVHKVHLLCLLAHVYIRNRWCNDDDLQVFLKRMLSKQTIALLNPAEDKPQFTRSTTFIDGLNQASDAFARRFRARKTGLRRPHWVDDPKSLQKKAESIVYDGETILSRDDFRNQAKKLEGSRDFGAQLFCALLRSAGVEARLVCSLQPLPFSGTVAKIASPVKVEPHYIIISSDDHGSSNDERPSAGGAATTPSQRKRLGRPQFTPSHSVPSTSQQRPRTPVRESSYPVYWVEAFNEAIQKWISVDPLVTKSLAKPSKFEPPAGDPFNCMSYVVAFDEDASARDVTRRYVKAFNAKTRKLRVESTKNGERWWKKALEYYEKPFMEDRDETEIGELTAKSAAEPMPRNVQDFKDHPIYVLERHLRRNQVIHPKRVIGHVGFSKSNTKKEILEPVYRRADVHTLRSADGWYRLGRDIRLGEQPLKRLRMNRSKTTGFEDSSGQEEDAQETPLYAEFQTALYQPPPIVNGRVPKNAYGNLDIYVPSMVPPGGIHIRNAHAARAAKILGVDYADAVTGFDFKGRHGTAVVHGIVIAEEYRDALLEVLNGLEKERHNAELEVKTMEALRLWRHFLLRLRIAERVKGYTIEGEANEERDVDEFDEEGGGGFIPDSSEGLDGSNTSLYDRQPQSAPDDRSSSHYASESDGNGGGFISEEASVTPIVEVPATRNTVQNRPGTIEKPPSYKSSFPRYNLIVVPNSESSGVTNSTSSRRPASAKEKVQSAKPTRNVATEAPITVDCSVDSINQSASLEPFSQRSATVTSQAQSVEGVNAEGSVSPRDGLSLMSEDPEDEDAIPEWLM